MLPESVLLGRSLEVDTSNVTAPTATASRICRPDSNRVGVAVGLNPLLNMNAANVAGVGPVVSGVFVPLVHIGLASGPVYLGIEQYGSIVTGELFVFHTAGADQGFGIGLFKLIRPLEE